MLVSVPPVSPSRRDNANKCQLPTPDGHCEGHLSGDSPNPDRRVRRSVCTLFRRPPRPQPILDMAQAMRSTIGNLAPGDIYPACLTPTVRWDGEDGT